MLGLFLFPEMIPVILLFCTLHSAIALFNVYHFIGIACRLLKLLKLRLHVLGILHLCERMSLVLHTLDMLINAH